MKLRTDYLLCPSRALILEPIFHTTLPYHGYIGAGPRYGVCPYQPAPALHNYKYTQKKREKGANNFEIR